MQPKVRIHRKGGFYYISLFARTKDGIQFEEIKSSGECAEVISEAATELILSLIRPDDEWCIITTPKRRHITEYHFATDICQKIAAQLSKMQLMSGEKAIIWQSRLSVSRLAV
jgi:hypothetical protein